MRFVPYDTTKYDFAGVFGEHLLRVDDLSLYHETFLKQKTERGEGNAISYDDNIAVRETFKRSVEKPWFFKLYRAFAVNVIAPLFGNDMTYNWPPVFRVHMAGSPSVSGFHRDVEVTGRHDLITVWVPFVDTFDTNSIWIEQEYGKRNFAPVQVNYGQALLFDSGYLWHGSVANKTNVTRFSMDFRVAPRREDLENPDLGILSARPAGYESQLKKVSPKTTYEYERPDV